MARFVDLTGKTFGKLTVQEYLGRFVAEGTVFRAAYYKCKCECGNDCQVAAASLRASKTLSCGCSKSHYALGVPSFKKTGMSRTPEYTAWIRMRRSCYDTDYKDYARYGARGIQVCEEWKNDFLAFFSYVGKRPSSKHSIDRYPNNNGNYEPGNVRWATCTQQARNRRSSKLIEFNGVTKSMVEWSVEFNIPYVIMKSRIRHNWTMERIQEYALARNN